MPQKSIYMLRSLSLYVCKFDTQLSSRIWPCILREADVAKERIEKLLKAGANVVLTTKGIDDMALKV